MNEIVRTVSRTSESYPPRERPGDVDALFGLPVSIPLVLKGSAKAEILNQLFPTGFIYAGDSAADIPVWTRASGIVLVNARKSVTDAARALGRPMLELSGRVGL